MLERERGFAVRGKRKKKGAWELIFHRIETEVGGGGKKSNIPNLMREKLHQTGRDHLTKD